MANLENKQGFRAKVVMFWFAIAAVTVAFLVLFGFMIFTVTTVDSIDDMKRANLTLKNDLTNAKESEYYVYIYSSKSDKNLEKKEEIEAVIFSYATFYQKNKKSGVEKIYAYDVDTYVQMGSNVYDYLKNLNSDIKQGNLPLLIEVVDGEVNAVYSTVNTASSELQTAMNQIKK